VAQVVECLPSKCEAPSSNPSTAPTPKKFANTKFRNTSMKYLNFKSTGDPIYIFFGVLEFQLRALCLLGSALLLQTKALVIKR
jgi:hypothetical protein